MEFKVSTMPAKALVSGIAATLLLMLAGGTVHAQDELRDTFFKDADAAKAEAEAADAALLAPRGWERGQREYRDAESALERGRNIETVRSNAADAERHFREAAADAKLARTALAQVLKSRQDAANARAPELSPELWTEAQREFGSAIRRLERDDLKRAKEDEIRATSLYRDAELDAIKKQYLSETRRLLEDADRARVGRYAPVTLERAQQLLARAERELSENRYDTDLPRSLAQQANYEAKHAIYLSEVVRDVRDRDLTVEELILRWEKPLAEIAATADVSPDMQDGPDALGAELTRLVQSLLEDRQRLEQELGENITRIADMEEELRALDERLGGATAERAALIQRLEAQARVKQQFEQVEKMFTTDEARVFRQGDTIILRLVGLTFDSGAAQIKPQNFDLLAKVEKAIDIFPRSELVIEGHTDSYGGDTFNQNLSQQRAESVQQYMINAMRIPSYRLIAQGYGETQPVSSNETETGRARNRRIDIVIKPNLESL